MKKLGKTKKYYVVWKGRAPGVYPSWEACKVQVNGFEGALFKSFNSEAEAIIAFNRPNAKFIGKDVKIKHAIVNKAPSLGAPILNSLAVDAACSGNPGKMEYRGVDIKTKKQVFIQGPFKNGTNNIGEFLAIVHGLAFLKNKNASQYPIYSDSKIAMTWVKNKQCRTNMTFSKEDKVLFELIKRAEKWLKENDYTNPILKWETKAWGEIPADFGRK